MRNLSSPDRVQRGKESRPTVLKMIRFVSLICAALAFGLTVAHDLEIPGKEQLRGADRWTVQKIFDKGYAMVGGLAEVLGLIPTGLLVYLQRSRRMA